MSDDLETGDGSWEDEMLTVLRSIDTTLKGLLSLSQQRIAQAKANQPKAVASDRDLDGKYGDPEVKFNPRDWNGPSMKQRRMSECPADFLDALAETLDYFADKAEETGETYNGKPTAPYKRKDAARARGWAARHRKNGDPSETPSSAAGWGEPEWPTDGGFN